MMTPSKWRDGRSYWQALMLSFVLALTAAAWAQTKPSDNPSTPTQAMPSTRNVGLLRDRPLFEEHVQRVAANEQDIAPNRQQMEQNGPVRTAVGKCASGQTQCGSVCVNTNSDNQNCGSCGKACGAGTGCCNGTCTNLNSSITNCGACGNVCNGMNGVPNCSAGSCGITCNPGFGNCDGILSNGCEANLNLDNHNCGACNNVCASGTNCSNGRCI